MTAEYGISEIAQQLHDQLARYIEATYHLRDTGLIEERRALLREPGTIAQRPYVETTPSYSSGPNWMDLDLPTPLGATFAEMSSWTPGIGIPARPFAHQAEALEAFFKRQQDVIVATGTGSGKTESFLLPILGSLLLEAESLPSSLHEPGCRALLLYPMNALVNDQVSRLRRMIGDPRVCETFRARCGAFPRFGMYTSRTPYPGVRSARRDNQDAGSLIRQYLDIARDNPTLMAELSARGRWPAKDLRAFFGADGGRWEQRLRSGADDVEMLTRHEMQERCPHLLVTNYSMLEYMLLRPIERNIFEQTRKWLAGDPQRTLILVLDEAHMYRGAGGAEIGFLIRRLHARLDIPRERLRCILTSASLGRDEESKGAAITFAEQLTGRPSGRSFTLVRGTQTPLPEARVGTASEASRLAAFDLVAHYRRVENPSGLLAGITALASSLNWPAPPNDRADALPGYLYDRLRGLGPLQLLVSRTSGEGTEFTALASDLFPDADADTARAATMTILALGTFARSGDRPLLPTRAHLFFRGLPPLYACINPTCDQRRQLPGERQLLGRLYTEPRTHCTCSSQARVYEVAAHRSCGAAFLRVFGQGRTPSFYWHERGGAVEPYGEPLDESYLFLEQPHPAVADKSERIWLDLATGRVVTVPPSQLESYRECYRPAEAPPPKAQDNGRKQGRNAAAGAQAEDEETSIGTFARCPACTRSTRSGISDLATHGEQPFANLVREQFVLQAPTREASVQYPNGGRKVLLFSDGRQRAARLARDLPREVELDSFRQALALAAQRLIEIGREPTLGQRLYIAFVAVCADFHLHFFDHDDGSQRLLMEHLSTFRSLYDGDLEFALDNDWRPDLPPRYSQALLRQLSDPYFSLYTMGVASLHPSRVAMNLLRKQLAGLPDAFLRDQLPTLGAHWIQALLDDAVFDPQINLDTRRLVQEYFRPWQATKPIRLLETIVQSRAGLNAEQLARIRSGLAQVLTERDAEANAYLKPSQLVLHLALDDPWCRCQSCGQLLHTPFLDRCTNCGGDRLQHLAPDDPYLDARSAYFRGPVRATLAGGRPMHITAEEHTAQLGQRAARALYATTEEYELRFQDVALSDVRPPIDVLSCTTTMEVGIDIGALTAIGLRNVPPQRQNYQQRAGRAGRRGSAVSTVLTYAQGGAHDNHYYQHPRAIISGEPQVPQVQIGNRRLARRHIHALLLQRFFHSQLDRLSSADLARLSAERADLFSAFGPARDFLSGNSAFCLTALRSWMATEVLPVTASLATEVAAWLPDELFPGVASIPAVMLEGKRTFIHEIAEALLGELATLALSVSPAATLTDESAPPSGEAIEGSLLDLLFNRGLLPSYAFPTDLCTFYVFERDGQGVRIKERPTQGKDRALSEYAPGRLLVINKQTYRVGGLFDEGARPGSPMERIMRQALPTYVTCSQCTYVREEGLRRAGEPCPICDSVLREQQVLDPPGFAPERGLPLRERDRDQEYSQATLAQLPTPINPDDFTWHAPLGPNLRHTHAENRRLIIVNKGEGDAGFRFCVTCGAMWANSRTPARAEHRRPYMIPWSRQQRGEHERCSGPLHPDPVYLGHSFLTDLLLLRLQLSSPLAYSPRDPWLHDAFRSVAEALALVASRHLDIDPSELSANYRLIPSGDVGDGTHAVADIYLYDTASGGAGYAAEASGALPAILREAIALMEHCPADCERSCTACLRHYGNRFWHDRLDRHLAAQLLRYADDGLPPAIASLTEQAQDLAPLGRYLELEGWSVSQEQQFDRGLLPLTVARSSGAQSRALLAIGTYPALLDPLCSSFMHPLTPLRSRPGVTVVLIPDYIVDHDLPTAAHHVLREELH